MVYKVKHVDTKAANYYKKFKIVKKNSEIKNMITKNINYDVQKIT